MIPTWAYLMLTAKLAQVAKKYTMVNQDTQSKSTVEIKEVVKMERVSWERYFMNIAREVSTFSTCDSNVWCCYRK